MKNNILAILLLISSICTAQKVNSTVEGITVVIENNKTVITKDNKVLHSLYSKYEYNAGMYEYSGETYAILYNPNKWIEVRLDGYLKRYKVK